MARKKEYLLRIDARLFEEIQAWAAVEFRSVNGQIEFVLNQAVMQRRRETAQQDDGAERAAPGQ